SCGLRYDGALPSRAATRTITKGMALPGRFGQRPRRARNMSGLRHKQTFALAIFLLAVHGILLLLSMLGRGPGSGAVLGAAALLALVSGLALAALSQGMLARRLRTVARAARLAAAGNLDTRIEDSGNSELAELAAAFDRMRERLRLSTVSTSQLEKM